MKCYVKQRHTIHTQKISALPSVLSVYRNTVGVMLETRNGKLSNCEGNIVL